MKTKVNYYFVTMVFVLAFAFFNSSAKEIKSKLIKSEKIETETLTIEPWMLDQNCWVSNPAGLNKTDCGTQPISAHEVPGIKNKTTNLSDKVQITDFKGLISKKILDKFIAKDMETFPEIELWMTEPGNWNKN